MTITIDQITDQLREPFPPKLIKFLPKTPKQREGKWFCMALPYADKRVYEDRLNALAPGQWETPLITALVADNKLIVFSTVIVCGIAHTDVGEAFLTSLSRKGEQREEENTATDAYAQAFKRACSQFGLGRYLYLLPKIWLPYDPDSRMIAISEGERVAWVEKLYMEAGLPPRQKRPSEKPSDTSTTPPSTQQQSAPSQQQRKPPADRVDAQLLRYLRKELTDEQAQKACRHYQVPDLAHLTAAQALHLSDYIENQKRAAAGTSDHA